MAYSSTIAAIIAGTPGYATTWASEYASYTEDQQRISLGLMMHTRASNLIIPPVVYSGDGAITLTDGKAVLTKGSAAAMTLAAPTAAQDGLELLITSGSSFAHVITGTNLFWAGQTGGPFNKITLAAFIGASAKVVAYNLLWHVTSDSPGAATVGD